MIRVAGSGPLQTWWLWVGDSSACIWKPMFSIPWAIFKPSVTYSAEFCMPWRQGCDLMSVQPQTGQGWRMKNGYSLSLILQKSWRHPRKLCGSRYIYIKKKQPKLKLFCTQPVTFLYCRMLWKPKAQQPHQQELGSHWHRMQLSWDNWWPNPFRAHHWPMGHKAIAKSTLHFSQSGSSQLFHCYPLSVS